jgi:Tfp pilus assembly protein PilN
LIRINLLPRAPKRRLPGGQFLILGLPLVALVAAILLSALILSQNAGLERDIATVRTEIADLQPTVARVLELDRQITVLREKEQVIVDLIKQQMPVSTIMAEIRQLIPKDVWVTNVNVPEPSAITIEGNAQSYYAVAQFMDNLAAGRMFRNIDLSVSQLERAGSREVVKYTITGRVQRPQTTGEVRQ